MEDGLGNTGFQLAGFVTTKYSVDLVIKVFFISLSVVYAFKYNTVYFKSSRSKTVPNSETESSATRV